LLKPQITEYEIADGTKVPKQMLAAIQDAGWPVVPDAEAAQRIESGAVAWLEGVFEPWLRDTAELRYDNLLALGRRRWWEPIPGSK
jgi:hypothetical protein